MKIQSTTLTVMAALLVFSVSLFGNANAAPRLCDDGTRPPCDGGGGGGGTEPPDFGDLIILLRDDNGVPIPSPATQVEDPETGLLVDGGLCWQPVAFNVEDVTLCPAECVVDTTDPATVSVSQLSCGVTAGCEGCTQEVDFGRINSARSPDEVYDSQLADVVVNLATADCVTLDPAGRLVASRVVDGESLSGAIDSPIQNLAIYKQLMLTGDLGVPLPDGASVFDTAARGIGAGSDKGGLVDVDLIAYLNQIMGLDTVPTYIGKLCETYREEVQGVIQLVEKCFLNYGSDPSDVPPAGADYAYDRIANFSMLPNPAYIPPTAPVDGWFEYLAASDVPNPDPDSTLPLFEIVYGPILETVFCTAPDELTGLCDPDTAVVDPGYTEGNIGGFAQAADDTRAVIDFMHNWPVPGNYPTPVPCEASGDIAYDVSISEVSGLQVPVTYINGTEREFIVTVANAGPDPATGTVTVTAVALSGASIPGSPWVFNFTDLAAGRSEAFTEPLVFDLGNSTTVSWTATAEAPFDVNPANNIVTATTSVRNTGGGQGGQGGRP